MIEAWAVVFKAQTIDIPIKCSRVNMIKAWAVADVEFLEVRHRTEGSFLDAGHIW